MLRSDGNNRMTEICDTLPELHIDPFPAAIWAGFPVSLPGHSMTISSSSSEASSETSETGTSSGDPSVRKPWCRWLPQSYLLVSGSEASSETSETGTSSGDPSGRKPWCRWLPRSYLLVFVINATATVLLWPADAQYPCPLKFRLFFFGLMLSSLGAGCVAAFLVRRAEASDHTKWACGYAIINWVQAMLGSLGMTNPVQGDCRYGVIPNPYLGGDTWFLALAFCRLLLYLVASFWMQTLIASRLVLLEQSSNRNYRSSCFRRLMWAQVFGTAVALLPIAGIFYETITGGSNNSGSITSWMSLIAIGGITLLCNVAASIVAICSFGKSYSELRRICRLAEANEAPISARSSLRRARRFAGLQSLGVSFSLVFTLLLVPARVVSMLLGYDDDALAVVLFLIQAFDALGNAVAVLLLSGSHRMAKVERSQGSHTSWKVEKPEHRRNQQTSHEDVNWTRKVEELSMRGMTLRSLLQFYQENLPSMPDWKYAPREHKTRDVVRRAIIPSTSREECSFSVSAFNKDGPKRAQVMVTHNWGNSFSDLLAAVLSDALQECSFSLPAELLQEECTFLQDLLAKMGRLDHTYWICAFAVNQHISICHSNPYDRDPFTNQLHPVCQCNSTNIIDSDGRSASSEINKFDDMMRLLATTGGCRQVIAVDKPLDLFRRAWCVAEIAEAKRLQMDQSLKLWSKATLQERARTLENLDVRDMRASSDKDKELILGKIQDVDDFNAKLQVLIFDPKSGLVATWNAMDSLQQIGEVGRLIKGPGRCRQWKSVESMGKPQLNPLFKHSPEEACASINFATCHPKEAANSDWIK